MDRRQAPHSDDDVPIIGDYSEAQNARLRVEAPSVPTAEPPPRGHPLRGDGRPRDERWVIDPSDLQRHARIARQLEGTRRFAKLRKYVWVAAVAAIGLVVYWKFDTLRAVKVDFSELKSFLGGDGPGTGVDARRPDGAQTATVETQAVAGIEAPTSRADTSAPAPPPPSERPPARRGPAAKDDTPASRVVPAAKDDTPASPVVPAANEDASASTAAPAARSGSEQVTSVAPPAPPAPAEPETFAFALPVNTVSESDAATAILVVRSGGNRGASSVIWWTTPGTATPGADYVDLGRMVEKFAPGEQNRTIRIPIVGDNIVEGPETFYVHLAKSVDGEEVELGQTEVVIKDDD